MRYLLILIALVLGTGAIAQTDQDIDRLQFFANMNKSFAHSSYTQYGYINSCVLDIVHISDLGTRKFQSQIEPLMNTPAVVNKIASDRLDRIRASNKLHQFRRKRFMFYRLVIVTSDNAKHYSDEQIL